MAVRITLVMYNDNILFIDIQPSGDSPALFVNDFKVMISSVLNGKEIRGEDITAFLNTYNPLGDGFDSKSFVDRVSSLVAGKLFP